MSDAGFSCRPRCSGVPAKEGTRGGGTEVPVEVRHTRWSVLGLRLRYAAWWAGCASRFRARRFKLRRRKGALPAYRLPFWGGGRQGILVHTDRGGGGAVRVYVSREGVRNFPCTCDSERRGDQGAKRAGRWAEKPCIRHVPPRISFGGSRTPDRLCCPGRRRRPAVLEPGLPGRKNNSGRPCTKTRPTTANIHLPSAAVIIIPIPTPSH